MIEPEDPIPELPDVYVRARDGALYKNPLLVLREGFAQFQVQDHGLAELVEWITDPPASAQALAERIFGRCFFLNATRQAERVVPFTKPFEYKPARIHVVQVVERIPRPTSSDGVSRYASRLPAGARVLEFPAGTEDAKRVVLK